MLLPAPGRYILRTHRRCNMLAFVQHFELPRYDSLEPLNVQQNCQLHTIYLNGWPHFVLTSVPGVAIQPGDLLFCDLGAGFFRSRRRALARQLALIARGDILPIFQLAVLRIFSV
ncbi:histone lysine set, partial [Cystoisospora suis]